MLPPELLPLLLKECTFSAVRSGGKGGQNVNKVATKVVLLFDVVGSGLLTDEQKALLLENLARRISADGFLQLTCDTGRTQGANRKLVEEKFLRIIDKALMVKAKRIATKPTAGSKEKRIRDKKSVSARKSSRKMPDDSQLTAE